MPSTNLVPNLSPHLPPRTHGGGTSESFPAPMQCGSKSRGLAGVGGFRLGSTWSCQFSPFWPGLPAKALALPAHASALLRASGGSVRLRRPGQAHSSIREPAPNTYLTIVKYELRSSSTDQRPVLMNFLPMPQASTGLGHRPERGRVPQHVLSQICQPTP